MATFVRVNAGSRHDYSEVTSSQMLSESVKPARAYTLLNQASGRRLAGNVHLAADSRSRRQGLLGIGELGRDGGLWINPCEAIHTFGMKMPIDVVFLDRQYCVRKLRESLPPGRISVCLRASSVVELRPGAIADSQTKVGDRLQVERAIEFGCEPASAAS